MSEYIVIYGEKLDQQAEFERYTKAKAFMNELFDKPKMQYFCYEQKIKGKTKTRSIVWTMLNCVSLTQELMSRGFTLLEINHSY